MSPSSVIISLSRNQQRLVLIRNHFGDTYLKLMFYLSNVAIKSFSNKKKIVYLAKCIAEPCDRKLNQFY